MALGAMHGLCIITNSGGENCAYSSDLLHLHSDLIIKAIYE
jgi:hypothetical protein